MTTSEGMEVEERVASNDASLAEMEQGVRRLREVVTGVHETVLAEQGALSATEAAMQRVATWLRGRGEHARTRPGMGMMIGAITIALLVLLRFVR